MDMTKTILLMALMAALGILGYRLYQERRTALGQPYPGPNGNQIPHPPVNQVPPEAWPEPLPHTDYTWV